MRALPLLLLACDRPALPEACARYVSLPDAAAMCVARLAAEEADPVAARAACLQTGALASDCLRQWVTGPAAVGQPLDALLAVCQGHDDCTLAALDARPAWDVTEQIGRCAAAGGAYANDCAVHALHRWLGTLPSPEDVLRVAAIDSPFPQAVGMYVAAASVCQGLTSCPGQGAVLDACQKGLPMARSDPRWCQIGPVIDGDYSL